MYKQAVIPLILILLPSCEKQGGFRNFIECLDAKTAQYVDEGSDSSVGWNRAYTFCNIKYPPLDPIYVHTPTEINFERLSDNRFRMILHERRDLVTFKVILTDGREQYFNRVPPTNMDGTWIVFNVDGPLKSIQISEILLNVNRDKHQGD
ncbi:hypothetical protein VYH29_001082 [Vibrio fluvialis]|nr:hypothetical protein [Vibrio fluvialis]